MKKLSAFVMVGLPASGKSTTAQEIAKRENAVVISIDDIRSRINGSPRVQSDWAQVFEIVEEEVAAAVEKGRPVVIDETNYRKFDRAQMTTLLRSYGYEWVEAIVKDVTLATALARNFKRNDGTPDYVIETMYEELQNSLRTICSEDFDHVLFQFK